MWFSGFGFLGFRAAGVRDEDVTSTLPVGVVAAFPPPCVPTRASMIFLVWTLGIKGKERGKLARELEGDWKGTQPRIRYAARHRICMIVAGYYISESNPEVPRHAYCLRSPN